MTNQEISNEIKKLREELAAAKAALAAKPARTISLKIGQSGALCVYGLGRFPVTLYKRQWLALLDDKVVSLIKNFIQAHPELADEKAATADKVKA